MRLYIAAPWKYRDQARVAGEQATQRGHVITEKWWDHEDITENSTLLPQDRKEMAKQAQADWDGVSSADAFIFLNLAYSEGKCVELGLALVNMLPIFAVGEPGMAVSRAVSTSELTSAFS